MKEIPNLTTMDDLITKVGELTLDSFNKVKVISQSWEENEKLAVAMNESNAKSAQFEAKLKSAETQVKTMEANRTSLKEINNQKDGTIAQKNLAIKDLKRQLLESEENLNILKESLRVEKIKIKKANEIPFKKVPVKKSTKKKTQAKA
jgi:septal ring factor EnvC (AmiA/AmiB activator)